MDKFLVDYYHNQERQHALDERDAALRNDLEGQKKAHRLRCDALDYAQKELERD